MEHDAKTAFPDLAKNISMTMTPMVFTARMMKQKDPEARMCFIGPCAAKKLEASRRTVRSDVDFVLTFEELAGIIEAKDVDTSLLEVDEAEALHAASAAGRGFAQSGGVAKLLPIRSRNGTRIWMSRSHPHRALPSARSC